VLGIIVHGDNHFIVRGPQPTSEQARALALHWTVIRIPTITPTELAAWTISTKEFREDLQWAFVIGADHDMQLAVRDLLAELVARGISAERV
jgi:hypothetical protein